MSEILTQLEAARAEVARVERLAAASTCRELGRCNMQSAGGANCGCPDGNCSVPVLKCTRCGDCDYSENEEAGATRSACAATREIPEGVYWSTEESNFYSIESRTDQGAEFGMYWGPRASEFPHCDCQCPPSHISMDCPIHG
jgi:hypothetical protein